jgi:opacity protein-like surface antigen
MFSWNNFHNQETMKKLFITSILLSVISFTAHAKNSKDESFYLKGMLGKQIGFVSMSGGIAAGAILSDNISTDISLSFMSFPLQMQKEENSLFKATGFGTNNVLSAMWNGYVYLNTDNLFAPYFMTGFGMSSAKSDVTEEVTMYINDKKDDKITNTINGSSSRKNYFTYQVGLGIRFNTEDIYSFDFGYRFSNIDMGKFDKSALVRSSDGTTSTIDLASKIQLKNRYSQSFVIGVNINF